MSKSDYKLKYEHELFCQKYVAEFNASKSYSEVYPNANDASCRALASDLLTNVNIVRRIDELVRDKIDAVKVTADLVLAEFQKLATVNPKDAFDDSGQLKSIHDMPEPLQKSIATIEVEELFSGNGRDRIQIGHTKKIKFWPKDKALENLGKYLKLFSDRMEHSGTIKLEDLLDNARKQRDEKKD